jgi:hypothetical protein
VVRALSPPVAIVDTTVVELRRRLPAGGRPGVRCSQGTTALHPPGRGLLGTGTWREESRLVRYPCRSQTPHSPQVSTQALVPPPGHPRHRECAPRPGPAFLPKRMRESVELIAGSSLDKLEEAHPGLVVLPLAAPGIESVPPTEPQPSWPRQSVSEGL